MSLLAHRRSVCRPRHHKHDSSFSRLDMRPPTTIRCSWIVGMGPNSFRIKLFSDWRGGTAPEAPMPTIDPRMVHPAGRRSRSVWPWPTVTGCVRIGAALVC